MSKKSTALSKEKLEIFKTEKNPENLLRFLVDDRADLISFIDDTNNYQSDELVDMIARNSIPLMGYVIKAAHAGKNSWNESKILNWLEENAIDILSISRNLLTDYTNYHLSHPVENKLFELLIQEQILDKNQPFREKDFTEKCMEIQYMKRLPIAYLKKFEEMDGDFLHSLLKRPVQPSGHMNLAQHLYVYKGQIGKHEEAQEVFNSFTSLVLKPVSKNINGYTIQTDICEYYLKEADQLETWEFFGSMDYKKLNDNQKEVYLATGISHLFNESNRPLRSRNYSQDDIMNALMVVPNDRLKYYIEANHTKMAKRTGDELLSLWMKNHLENELGSSPKVKGIKI